jgi:hypothetical protein
MAEVKFTARDEQFIAACTRMNGAVGALAAKMNIQLTNSFKEADYVTNNFAKGIGKAADRMQSFGQSLSTYVTLPIVGLGAAMAKTFMDIDTLKRGLTSVMGSAAAAEKEFINLREVAKLPGLGLEEAAQGSVMLQAAGMSAAFARRELLSVGNALATVGKGKFELERVNNQLVQIYNKASGFGEDVKTISQSLPQLRKVMLEAFGTMDTAAISKKFTGKEFVEKIIVELEKLPKATGGFKNAWENLTDSLKIGGFEIFSVAERAFNLGGKLDGLGQSVEGLLSKFKELSPEAQTAILTVAGLAAATGPLTLGIGAVIQLLPTLSLGFKTLSGSMGIVGIAAVALVGAYSALKASTDGVAAASSIKNKALADAKRELKGAVEGTGEYTQALRELQAQSIKAAIAQAQLSMSSPTFGDMAKAYLLGGGNLITGLSDVAAGKAIQIKELQTALKDLYSTNPLNDKATAKGGGGGAGGSETEFVKTQASIDKLNGVLDRQKSNLDKLKEAAEEYSKELRKLRDIILGMDGLKPMQRKEAKPLEGVAAINPFAQIANQLSKMQPKINESAIFMDNNFQSTLESMFSGVDGKLTNVGEKLQSTFAGFSSKQKKVALELTKGFLPIADAMSAGFEAVGAAIANGKNPFAAFGKAMLAAFGDILSGIGREMLKKAAKLASVSIASGGALSGVAIRTGLAGAGLVAAGGAMKASATRAFAKGGMVGGPTNALFGEYIGAANNNEVVAPLSNLLGIIQKAIQPVMLQNVGMGGGRTSVYSESRLRGSDLYVSQIRENRINLALRG